MQRVTVDIQTEHAYRSGDTRIREAGNDIRSDVVPSEILGS